MIWSLSLYTKNGNVFTFSSKYTRYGIRGGMTKDLYDLTEHKLRDWISTPILILFQTDVVMHREGEGETEPWKDDEDDDGEPDERRATYYIDFSHIFAYRIILCTDEEIKERYSVGPELIP